MCHDYIFYSALGPPVGKPSNYYLKFILLTFLTSHLDDNGPAIAGGTIGAISLVIVIILIILTIAVLLR